MWRTACLLKIAALIYKEKINEIEREEKQGNRRMSLAHCEFSDYVANLVKSRTLTHNRIEDSSHENHDLDVHDFAQVKLYDDMLKEIKNENSHLKLSKFISQVEERT